MTILGSRSGTGSGLGLLDITLGDAILMSPPMLDLGASGWLVCSSLGDSDMEPAEAAWSHLLRKEFKQGLLNKPHQATDTHCS